MGWAECLESVETDETRVLLVPCNKREEEDEDAERDKRRVEDLHHGEKGHKGNGKDGDLLKDVAAPLKPICEWKLDIAKSGHSLDFL